MGKSVSGLNTNCTIQAKYKVKELKSLFLPITRLVGIFYGIQFLKSFIIRNYILKNLNTTTSFV